MAKVKVGFSKINILQKRQMVAKIKRMMAGNPNFSGAAVYLTALDAADALMGNAYAEAETARAESKIKTTIQNLKEKALDGAMAAFANAIQLESGGDTTKILSSGLEVQDAPVAATIPHAPMNLSVTRGDDSGEIHFHFDPVSEADSYLVRWCVGEAPIEPWTMVQTTFSKSNGDVSGLTSGSHVWVEVLAHNTAGDSPWSNASDIYVP